MAEITIIIEIVVLSILIGLLVILVNYARLANRSLLWTINEATILECKVSTYSAPDSPREWKIKILYSYKIGSTEYHGTKISFGYNFFQERNQTMFQLEDCFKNAKNIKIRYNPIKPNQSVIDPGISSNPKPAMFIVCFVVIVFTLFLLKQLF